jgi:hypothetical protein
VPETGGVIGHEVVVARHVGNFVIVAVMASVDAGASAQVGGGTRRGGGSLAVAGHSWSVVTEGAQGSFAEVVLFVGNIGMG